MIDDKYKLYLNSKEWFSVKQNLFKLRGKKCEMCNSTDDIQVHHLHYDNIYMELPTDLLVVCKTCHRDIHGLNPKSKKKKKKKKMTLKQRRKVNILKEIENNRRYLLTIYH